jgi:nucleoside-diphosphate-sugar epimerase
VARVLLTGGSGFIGRQALPLLLEQGHEVHASFRTEPGEQLDGLHWHRADLLEADDAAALIAATQPTHLLHFAWYAEHGKFWTSPENLRWVEATLRLVRLFAEAGGERAVLAGSCAEYDWSPGGGWDGVCREGETTLAPATLYGKSKRAAGVALEAWAPESGLSLAWGRIFFMYGPQEHPDRLVASLARSLLEGRPAPTSEGTQRRDFLHVADVADAFVTLLDSEVAGAVNVGSGDPVPVRRVVELVAEAAGNPELVRWGELPMRPGDPPVLVAAVERLRDELGWSPRRSLEAGISDTVEWWSANR